MDKTAFIEYPPAASGRRCVNATALSELLNIPKQVLCWTVENETSLTYKEDYFRLGRQNAQYLNIKALLFALDKFCNDYDDKVKVITAYMNIGDTSITSYKEKYESLQVKYDNIMTKLKAIVECENAGTADMSETKTTTTNTPTTKQTATPKASRWAGQKRTSESAPITDDEKRWQADQMEKLRSIASKLNENPSQMLNKIYRKMNKVYGIVWEQEKKERKEERHIDDTEYVSILYAVSTNETLRSIFAAILNDICANKEFTE